MEVEPSAEDVDKVGVEELSVGVKSRMVDHEIWSS